MTIHFKPYNIYNDNINDIINDINNVLRYGHGIIVEVKVL